MGIIYRLTDTQTGLIYIGQSRRPLFVRWQEHQHKALLRKKGGLLGQAIRDHGPNAFLREVIEEVEDESQLNAREQFWIEHYGSHDPLKGLNETKGGEAPVSPTGKPLDRGNRKRNSKVEAGVSRARWKNKTEVPNA